MDDGMKLKMEEGKTVCISEEGMDSITERLSSLENLYFPRSLHSSISTPPLRQALLRDLLSRDVAVFLERYGAHLTSEELAKFDACGDYEINWHLKLLQKKRSSSVEEVKVRVKNRRVAYMERLEREGSYFSEEAMREREPYLHHEFVGKYEDGSGRGMARPGERWSDTLMRRCEEAVLLAKIRDEQIRIGVHRSEWVGGDAATMEEEEQQQQDVVVDDDDDDEFGVKKSHNEMSYLSNGAETSREHHSGGATISEEEKQDMMNQFTYIMHQKFLAGEDHQHLDYSKIDDDETLDDHWLREANQDAEEKYFDESDGNYFSDEDDKR